LLLLIAGLWYGLALWKGGEEFFSKQIMQENVLRFFASGAAGAGHEHPFYYFVPNLFLGMLPWSFFFPPLVWFLYQRCRLWGMTESFLYLIVWIATVFIFYSASSSKRSVYILSLYPALALLLGAWWQELRRGGVALPLPFFRLMQVSGAFCLMLLSVAIAGVAAQALGYEPLALVRPFLHPKDQSNLPLFTGIVAAHAVAFLLWCGVAGAAAVMLVGGIQRRYWGWVFAALAAFTVSTALLVNRVFQPEIATARTFRPFMARVVRHVGDNPVFFYRTFDSGALYYADRRIPFYDPALRQAEQSCFLLMWEEEWTKIAQQDGAGLSAVDVSEGTGPKGKRRLVLVSVSADASVPLAEEIPVEDETSEDAL
jgi:4-amino-4-deoxy-L-arabinose transferase-like glycosyltransferase